MVLHTAARRYLLDRWRMWVDRYSALPNEGRTAGEYRYTRQALATFPRYNVLNARRVEVERLDPDRLPSVGAVADHLILAGHLAQDLFTEGGHGILEAEAMKAERDAFLAWVEATVEQLPGAVEPLPYHRTLSADESVRWWRAVEERWNLENRGWWEPFTPSSNGADVLPLVDSVFWSEDGAEGPATHAVRAALASLGVNHVIELREFGPDYEIDVGALEPTYNGAEGPFTSEGVDWLIFASHEGTTALGGVVTDRFREAWPDWREAVWTHWRQMP